MVYKICIVKNRYTKPLNLFKGIDWFKRIPLEIQIDEICTDFDITEKAVWNATYKGAVCGDDIYPKLRALIPEGKYNCVAFIYGNELNEIRVYGYNGEPLYKDTDLIQLYKIDDKGKVFNHELFHALFNKLRRVGVYLDDPMDTYFNNDDLDANPSNRTIALQRLSAYWKEVVNIGSTKPTMPPDTSIPKVTIIRRSDDGKQALGDLNTGTFVCKTLERPWKNNQSNISCVPVGVYKVRWTFSPRLLRFTYELQGVMGRSGIRIHVGNFFFNVNGCILLGDSFSDVNGDLEVDVLHSRNTIKAFENLMQKKEFTLEIK